MKRFFLADNAIRSIKFGDFVTVFDVIDQIGGAWYGVYATDDEALLAAIEKDGPRLGVSEITEDEYNAQLKKKVNSSSNTFRSEVLRIPLPSQNQRNVVVAGKASGAVLSTKGTSEPLPSVADRPTVEAVVTVGEADYIEPLDIAKPVSKKAKRK